MADFWSTLDGFNGVKPAERQNGPRRSEVGTLPEGDYEFQIADLDNKIVGDDSKALLVLGLRVMTPLAHAGQVLDFNYWLTDEGAVSRCFADLVVLGMDGAAPFVTSLQAFLPKLLGAASRGGARTTRATEARRLTISTSTSWLADRRWRSHGGRLRHRATRGPGILLSPMTTLSPFEARP